MKMLEDLKRLSGKTGHAPGSLVQVGEQPDRAVTATQFSFSADELNERSYTTPAALEPFGTHSGGGVEWIDLDGIHDLDWVRALGKRHGLHPLVLEDIAHAEQRTKLDEFDGFVYVVLRMLSFNAEAEELQDEQVSIVMGPGFVLSFQERPGDVFDMVRGRLRDGRKKIRAAGSDYLAYALIDAIVDHYFVVLERLGDRIEQLEEDVSQTPEPETLEKINRCKRELLFLRKSVWPLREVISQIHRGESPHFAEETRVYLRDVYDHTIQVIDTVESLRDIASGLVDLYLSSVSHRMNEVMKVLTIIATIFIPLTFIAGVYGMNFAHMPELASPWGYPIVLGVMLLVAVGMIIFFKRRRWF